MANKKRFHRKAVTSEISIKSLLWLLDTSDPKVIINALSKRKAEFEKLMKSNLKSDELIALLKMLFHIYNMKNGRNRSELLAITQSEEFIDNIKNYLLNINNDGDVMQVIDFILHFVDVNINELPMSDVYYQRFQVLLKLLHDVQVDSRFCNTYLWTHELTLLLHNKLIHRNRTTSSWKELSIFPNAVDMFEKKDWTPNMINGKYKNITEYLDITFKLLKEDFEICLKDGIMQMKAEFRGANEIENKDIYIYNNVNVERVEVDKNPKNGVIHRIAFSIDEKDREQINMKKYKSFKNGSLLLLSIYSQFTTFVVATLIEDVELQESEMDSCKILKISVIGDPLQLKPYWQYTMIEPITFFEPYYQVLRALQSKSTTNFPMEKYIIYSDSSPCCPSYISVDTEYIIDNKPVKLFSKDLWPNDILNLDHSQMDALRSALTHEFVLIYGPPGTGKTHLAENIINVLINNKTVLSTPILLVSSTNRSIDYILEALAIKDKKVIRLGGQTKSTILKKCLLTSFVKRVDNREIKQRIDNTKEIMLWKIDKNKKVDAEVEIMKEQQNSYIELYEREAAAQLLAGEVDVIGGTTSGCARLHYLIKRLQPEVVIVENANEVLESHVVATLSEGCKHLILIGDYKQLKPKIANRNPSESCNLDVSLFERMAKSGMHCCTLTEQHRMSPEIGALIAPSMYEKMNYHADVLNLPKVKGMRRNLYFINHDIVEDRVRDFSDSEYSYSNKHEGDMLLALANYLLKQGYSIQDLTILVPYTAQQNYMKKAAEKNYPCLKDANILIIDNFTGSENKIVLLSLVRSHSTTIGFVSTPNRIIVALSRANIGLYIIGNMKTLMHGSEVWSSLNTTLRKQQAIGKSIHLECQTHQTVTVLLKKQDFENISNGGCNLNCKLPLDCGHLCKLKCHPLLEKHQKYVCKDPCTRHCEQNLHKCKKMCYQDCGPCNESTEIILPCGHTTQKKCSEVTSNQLCMQPTIVSFLCCLQRVVPCHEADSCCYSRIVQI